MVGHARDTEPLPATDRLRAQGLSNKPVNSDFNEDESDRAEDDTDQQTCQSVPLQTAQVVRSTGLLIRRLGL